MIEEIRSEIDLKKKSELLKIYVRGRLISNYYPSIYVMKLRNLIQKLA